MCHKNCLEATKLDNKINYRQIYKKQQINIKNTAKI